MKVLFVTCLLAASFNVALASPAATCASSASTKRPLVRYLTATLHLSRHKARQVQRAMLHHPLLLNTPEQVGERLRPVLSAAQMERYTTLQGDVSAYEMLHYLAVQR